MLRRATTDDRRTDEEGGRQFIARALVARLVLRWARRARSRYVANPLIALRGEYRTDATAARRQSYRAQSSGRARERHDI